MFSNSLLLIHPFCKRGKVSILIAIVITYSAIDGTRILIHILRPSTLCFLLLYCHMVLMWGCRDMHKEARITSCVSVDGTTLLSVQHWPFLCPSAIKLLVVVGKSEECCLFMNDKLARNLRPSCACMLRLPARATTPGVKCLSCQPVLTLMTGHMKSSCSLSGEHSLFKGLWIIFGASVFKLGVFSSWLGICWLHVADCWVHRSFFPRIQQRFLNALYFSYFLFILFLFILVSLCNRLDCPGTHTLTLVCLYSQYT